MYLNKESGLYAVVLIIYAVKKSKGNDLTKVIEGYKFVIINTNFFFHPSLYLFISIYYDKSEPFN